MAFDLRGTPAMRRMVAGAAASLVLAATLPVAVAQPQPAAPTVALPDFTQVVAETEGSVVNIRTTEAVPVRRSPMGPGGGADPSDLFRWFFGPDFVAPGVGSQQQPQQHLNLQTAPDSAWHQRVPQHLCHLQQAMA